MGSSPWGAAVLRGEYAACTLYHRPVPTTPPRSTRATPAGPGRVALVLDAGGARSAYQVGALDILLPELGRRGERPTVYVGTSAGALLTGALAATAHRSPEEQAVQLRGVLAGSTKSHVMRPLWQQVPVVAARYASETLGLSFFRLRGLFGTGPLARTLGRVIDWDDLHRNVETGELDAVSVTATAVRTGEVVMFTESSDPLPSTSPGRQHRFVRTSLGVEHLMASSAIPVLFPSVRVDAPAEAAGWYVDGATRRRELVAPALDLGADRVVVVGTGSLHRADPDPAQDLASVDIGDGGAALLGSVMDDPLRHDLRRLTDVNHLIADVGLARAIGRYRKSEGRRAYRTVPFVAIAPDHGEELSQLAMDVFRTNHATVRRTLGDPDLQVMHRLMGSDSPLQGEMLSYLLFDADFFREAAELGRRDARLWLEDHPDLWRTEALAPRTRT